MGDVLALAFISLLGAMSPGPDFAIVSRYALSGSRKAAIMASFGVFLALIVHVSYCILGVGLFLKSSPVLFRSLQLIGSCYLAYLGVQLFVSSTKGPARALPSAKKALMAGFLTNLLNPKATLFILSLLTQFIGKSTPFRIEITFGLIICIVGLLWFVFLSFLMTHKAVLQHLQKFQYFLSRIMGIVLIGLALFVVFCG